MGAMLSRNAFPVSGRTVLIQGGSRGMGLSVARQLAEKGANVVIVARNVEKLQEGMVHVSKGACSPQTQRFHYISADLVDASESTRVFAETTSWNGGSPPDVVWCCAGSAYPTLFIDTPLEQFQNMMDSNYFTSVYMAHAALNAWLRPTNGDNHPSSDKANASPASSDRTPLPRHLIFTASFVSFYTFAGYTQYSPAKAALRSLSDSLSQEMNLYAAANPSAPRVKLHTIFPATIFTDGLDAENRVKADVTRMLEEGDPGQTPDQVAEKSIRGLERGEELVTTTLLTRLVMAANLGGSVRGGLVKGTVDTILSWVVVIVMVFVRWDMDRKVSMWGKKYGASNRKRE